MSVSDNSFIRAIPLLAVRDVRSSTAFYQRLLATGEVGIHEHADIYQRLSNTGELVLQLHKWDEHDHPGLTGPDKAPVGHGVVIWFEVDDFDAALARVRDVKADVVQEPERNDRSGQREVWLRDPDGYIVVIAGPPNA